MRRPRQDRVRRFNIRRDQWRRQATRRRHAERTDRNGAVGISHEPAVIARTVVWRALDALPPRRRAVIVMHEIEGLPVTEIASMLGIAAVTVRWHLSRGRRELARRLGSREDVHGNS
jgi:RNA polymerase sigma-70 factor (ECF subfamily)